MTQLRMNVRGAALLAVIATLVLSLAAPVRSADKADESESRLLHDIKFLASDELEGRGVGSKGLNQAADFIRDEFEKAGLNVRAVNGGAFQPFEMTVDVKLGEPNSLAFQGPDNRSITPKLGEDFTPLSLSASGKLDAEIVFCGYGIDAPKQEYNDFAGIDLEGKVALIMRREPQQGNPHTKFGGPHGGLSEHSALNSKIANAFGKGAAAVIFVDDPHSAREAVENLKKQISKFAQTVADAAEEFDGVPNDSDEQLAAARKKLSETVARMKDLKQELARGEPDKLMKFGYGGKDSTRSIPLLQVTRKTADELLSASLGKKLADIEKEIDGDLKPRSAVLTGWKAEGVATVDRERTEVKNVIGVLEGEGPLADETVVVGAHYDHVGRGGPESLSPGSKEIHNGADDNASGTVSLIELARRFAARKTKLPRRLVFIAFTGEEKGLFGSAEYVKNPVFPLDKTVAMINMDMVGRLQDDKLTIFGTGTSSIWAPMVERLAKQDKFELTMKPEGFGPSDQSSFYAKEIPVLHFFTGNHTDYHRPSDDWDKINVPGMNRVADMVEQVVTEVAQSQNRPDYIKVKSSSMGAGDGSRPYFGSIPDFGTDKPGYALAGVGPGSPAEKAGLKGGDRIIKMAGKKIDNLEDFDSALKKLSAGETVEVVVARDDKELTLKVTLDKPR